MYKNYYVDACIFIFILALSLSLSILTIFLSDYIATNNIFYSNIFNKTVQEQIREPIIINNPEIYSYKKESNDNIKKKNKTKKETILNKPIEKDTIKEPVIQSGGAFINTEDTEIKTDILLYKTVQAEAGNQGYYGKTLVASVVMNRVYSEDFPDTIKDVVYENNQFSVVKNGTLKKAIPDEETIKAVNTVLTDGTITDATYFKSGKSSWHDRHLKKLFTHKDHTFYKEM